MNWGSKCELAVSLLMLVLCSLVSHSLVLFPLIQWSGKYFLQNETASTGATEMQFGPLVSAQEKSKGSRGCFMFYIQPDRADMVSERCLPWSCT